MYRHNGVQKLSCVLLKHNKRPSAKGIEIVLTHVDTPTCTDCPEFGHRGVVNQAVNMLGVITASPPPRSFFLNSSGSCALATMKTHIIPYCNRKFIPGGRCGTLYMILVLTIPKSNDLGQAGAKAL